MHDIAHTHSTYQNTFQIIKADTDELREKAFRLRYEVYCTENGYEHEGLKGREFDAYDETATHYLLIHRVTGVVVGTGRIILPNVKMLDHSFPLQETVSHSILQQPEYISSICQISRLCMSAHFRRRDDDGKLLPAYHDPGVKTVNGNGSVIYVRRKIPYAPLGLFAALFEEALNNNLMNVVALFEKSQIGQFQKMGISYKILGTPDNHDGDQQAVVFNIKTVFDNMLLENSDCWDIMTDSGRLHRMANDLYESYWEDSFLKIPLKNNMVS